jgi:hypothetical protein
VALQVLQIASRQDVGEGVDFPHRSILATTPHPSSRRRRRPGPPLDEPAVIDEALALGDKLGEVANLQQQRDATRRCAHAKRKSDGCSNGSYFRERRCG